MMTLINPLRHVSIQGSIWLKNVVVTGDHLMLTGSIIRLLTSAYLDKAAVS